MDISLPQSKVRQLINRGSFGPAVRQNSVTVSELYKDSEKIAPLQKVEKPSIEGFGNASQRDKSLRKEKVKELFTKSRAELMKVNTAWIVKMVGEPTLRERMTFFWHNHFACRTLVPYFAQQQNNILRTFALSSFSELLMAVSKDPAMLQFLNNQQNKKDHPNENFAREVMELFTLGRGNYTETDVKEAARAFTGWGFNLDGEFQFRPHQHDYSLKSFRGKTQDFTGEQIIDMILNDRRTAVFITTKFYRHFVSERNISVNTIHEWADSFYRSGYDILKLLNVIFESNEFNDPVNFSTRIKSPVELLVGIQRHTGGKFENPGSLVFLQRAMGQILFYPPNVSGWPSGREWIDSSSLAFRVMLPTILFKDVETDFQTSDDGDANGLDVSAGGARRIGFKVDWESLASLFTKSSLKQTVEGVESFLLSRPTTDTNRRYVTSAADSSLNEVEFVKRLFQGFMSLPEYQMC